MDDYNTIRSQDLMTASIFSFLENLLAAVRTSETLASEAQERDHINISNDIKPGGYSDDIFIFLSEREREEYTCCVCYLVIKDAHQCSNGHKFCYSCIYVWSTCNRTGADCCPACRCEGIYARNEQINEKICAKRVKCKDDGCNWRGFLRDYIEHEHRHYEFKELSRSIDLPNITPNDSLRLVSPTPLPLTEPTDIDKIIPDTAEASSPNDIHSTTVVQTNISHHNEPVSSTFHRTGVSRMSIAPRRLSRLSDTSPSIVRTSGPRSIVHNYSRQPSVYTQRCTNYPPRPPRTSRTSNRANEQPVQPVRTNDNIDAQRMNQNESTQTTVQESRDIASRSSSYDHSNSNSRNQSSHSPLFPPINSNARNSLSTERPVMEYRRLAPTYASRRQNMGYLNNDGHENFTRMLILLTSDLEDRIPGNRNHLGMSHQRSNGSDSNLSSTNNTTTNTTSNEYPIRGASNRASSRLQEFRNLNRRLSEVANSLDMLIESTSRQATLNHSNDSSTSGTTSDTE